MKNVGEKLTQDHPIDRVKNRSENVGKKCENKKLLRWGRQKKNM